MKRTVFYSWQSDLPPLINRNLIEDSLRKALSAIKRDDTTGIEPVLDRDTANLTGAPDIAHSIMYKIAMADVFVADVSIINQYPNRLSPNPNVLIELGYAISELGWENVVLVQNTAFGGPELLPFDLRGRRTIVYHMPVDGDRKVARALLQGRLESSLRAALTPSGSTGNLPAGPNAPLWWGKWVFEPAPTAGGVLFIREVGAGGFLFDLDVYNGAHVGQITAYARILSADVAYCRLTNSPGYPDGELVFRRRWGQGTRTIEIEESARCSYYAGMRAHFSGLYVKKPEPWFDRGFLNELELVRLYILVGEHIERMRACTADISEGENLEEVHAKVIVGGVAGLYTEMESIVILNQQGQMWAAYIDGDAVHYFTNVPEDRDQLPRTIEAWRVNFKKKVVKYCESVKVVPTLGA